MNLPYPIRVALVDDHSLVRDGIKALLAVMAPLEVVGEAEGGAEAIGMVGRCQPDLLLVDISLRDQSDQSAFRQRQQEEGGRQSRSVPNEPAADDAVVVMDPAPVRRLVRLGGVDLSI